jgi:hypothetical protein
LIGKPTPPFSLHKSLYNIFSIADLRRYLKGLHKMQKNEK